MPVFLPAALPASLSQKKSFAMTSLASAGRSFFCATAASSLRNAARLASSEGLGGETFSTVEGAGGATGGCACCCGAAFCPCGAGGGPFCAPAGGGIWLGRGKLCCALAGAKINAAAMTPRTRVRMDRPPLAGKLIAELVRNCDDEGRTTALAGNPRRQSSSVCCCCCCCCCSRACGRALPSISSAFAFRSSASSRSCRAVSRSKQTRARLMQREAWFLRYSIITARGRLFADLIKANANGSYALVSGTSRRLLRFYVARRGAEVHRDQRSLSALGSLDLPMPGWSAAFRLLDRPTSNQPNVHLRWRVFHFSEMVGAWSEKWAPVFGQDHAHNKEPGVRDIEWHTIGSMPRRRRCTGAISMRG